MKNIFFTFFESVFSLESFLLEINCKMSSPEDDARLKAILHHFTNVVIAFDFKLQGPFRSYIEEKYTYEQLLYMCFMKVNESPLLVHENHLLRCDKIYDSSVHKPVERKFQLNDKLLSGPTSALLNHLLGIENFAVSYFLSKHPHDGHYWRQLFSLVVSSIMKYIIIYSFVFRRLQAASHVYVQVMGQHFNVAYKKLVQQKLQDEEKQRKSTVVQIVKARKSEERPMVIGSPSVVPKSEANLFEALVQEKMTSEANKENHKPTSQNIATKEKASKQPRVKKTNLCDPFEAHEEKLCAELSDRSTVQYQLKTLGHESVSRTMMLYDRCLNSKISSMFLYSNKTLEANRVLGRRILDEFVLKRVDLKHYPGTPQDIDTMKNALSDILAKLAENFRKCPFKVFLDYSCRMSKAERRKNEKNATKPKEIIQLEGSRKRKRSSEVQPSPPPLNNNLKSHIAAKKVFCFARRCLMFALDYDTKSSPASVQTDNTVPLIGGKDNFDQLVRHIRPMLFGLKYDVTPLNSFLHGIKFARIGHLASVRCDRYKRLILMSLIRWLVEDYTLRIVRAWFYVTDTSNTNSQLFFYLKSDWKVIVSTQLSDPVAKNYSKIYNLEKIKEEDAIAYCKEYRSNGYHLGRLLPKNVDNECRVISGSRVVNPFNKRTFKVNNRFTTLNNCLKWLIRDDPSLIGFSSGSHREMHDKYYEFLKFNHLNRVYSNEKALEPLKKWHFMKMDLRKCFDSVDIAQVIDYVSGLFNAKLGNSHIISILRTSSVQFDIDKKQLKAKYDHVQLRHDKAKKGFSNGIADYIAMLEAEFGRVEVNKREQRFNVNDIVYVTQFVHKRNVDAQMLNDMLHKCLEHVLIKIHDDIYERTNGILQGSICSRNLCDLYLGSIEKKLFAYTTGTAMNSGSFTLPMQLNRANEIVLRMVDDYLVIASDPDRLERIKALISKRVTVNDKKTVLHKWTPASITPTPMLACETSGPALTSPPQVNTSEDSRRDFNFLDSCSHRYFTWCGYDFDVDTLDVYFNYAKYFGSATSLRGRFSDNSACPFAFVVFNAKFLRLFQMNVCCLVMDQRLNSLQAILRNFVDIFALSCVRFQVLAMPQQIASDPVAQFRLLNNICHFANNKLKYQLRMQLLNYFYSTLALFKHICLSVYEILIEKKAETKCLSSRAHILKLIKNHIKRLDFERCIKLDATEHLVQINQLIGEQVEKFFKCSI